MAVENWPFRAEQRASHRITRFSLPLENLLINPSRSPNLAISPDGSRLAFAAAAQPGGRAGIFIRAFDQDEAKVIAGASGGALFFSPDGQWLAFYHPATQAIRKIALGGGAPVTLASAVARRRKLGRGWQYRHWILRTLDGTCDREADEDTAPPEYCACFFPNSLCCKSGPNSFTMFPAMSRPSWIPNLAAASEAVLLSGL